MEKTTPDYIETNDPNKSLLERYGYTKEQFIAWATGKSSIPEPKNIPQSRPQPKILSEEEQKNILDDFI